MNVGLVGRRTCERRTCGSSDLWVFGLVGRRTYGKSDLWVVGLVGSRTCDMDPKMQLKYYTMMIIYLTTQRFTLVPKIGYSIRKKRQYFKKT